MNAKTDTIDAANDVGANNISAWLNDPMGSVVTAGISVMISFTVVLSGSGLSNTLV